VTKVKQVIFTPVALAVLLGSASAQDKRDQSCEYRRMDSVIVTRAEVPLYPPLAVQANVSAAIDIRIIVKGGVVVSTDPMPGANPMLSIAARENLKTWQFTTQSYGDFCVRYEYELKGEAVVGSTNPTVEMHLPDRVKIVASPAKIGGSD
jgi:hypothetical protein